MTHKKVVSIIEEIFSEVNNKNVPIKEVFKKIEYTRSLMDSYSVRDMNPNEEIGFDLTSNPSNHNVGKIMLYTSSLFDCLCFVEDDFEEPIFGIIGYEANRQVSFIIANFLIKRLSEQEKSKMELFAIKTIKELQSMMADRSLSEEEIVDRFGKKTKPIVIIMTNSINNEEFLKEEMPAILSDLSDNAIRNPKFKTVTIH